VEKFIGHNSETKFRFVSSWRKFIGPITAPKRQIYIYIYIYTQTLGPEDIYIYEAGILLVYSRYRSCIGRNYILVPYTAYIIMTYIAPVCCLYIFFSLLPRDNALARVGRKVLFIYLLTLLNILYIFFFFVKDIHNLHC